MTDPWIGVKEAAALLGYNADYFRRTFCEPAAPLLPIRQRRGPKGRRRILVLRAAVEALVNEETALPACGS